MNDVVVNGLYDLFSESTGLVEFMQETDKQEWVLIPVQREKLYPPGHVTHRQCNGYDSSLSRAMLHEHREPSRRAQSLYHGRHPLHQHTLTLSFPGRGSGNRLNGWAI
jgi:hypothetical protein